MQSFKEYCCLCRTVRLLCAKKKKTPTLSLQKCIQILQNAQLNLCTITPKSVHFAFVSARSLQADVLWTGHEGHFLALAATQCVSNSLSSSFFFSFISLNMHLPQPWCVLWQWICICPANAPPDTAPVKVAGVLCNCEPPVTPPASDVASAPRTAPRPLSSTRKGLTLVQRFTQRIQIFTPQWELVLMWRFTFIV